MIAAPRVKRHAVRGLVLGALVCLAAVVLPAGTAGATDYHWMGAGTGTNTAADPNDPNTWFSNPANWQEGNVPVSPNSAILGLSAPGTIYVSDANVASFTVNGSSHDAAVGFVSGGTLAPGGLIIGDANYGQVFQTGGTVVSSQPMCLGKSAGGTGNYYMSGGSLKGTTEYVGYFGAGTFTQTGGTHKASTVYLGYKTGGSSGYYSLQGGSFAATVYGILEQSGGTFTGSAGGTYRMTGGVANLTPVISGTFPFIDLQNGQLFTHSSYNIKNYTQSGGTHLLQSSPNLYFQSGTCTLSGGTFGIQSVSDGGHIFVEAMDGASFKQTGGFCWIGSPQVGNDYFSLTGGLLLGSYSEANYELQDGLLVVDGSERIGYGADNRARGTFTQAGGVNLCQEVRLGDVYGAFGIYNLSGGSLGVNGESQGFNSISVRNGRFTQSGGTVTGDMEVYPAGTYSIHSGRLIGTHLTYGGTVQQTGGTIDVAGPEYVTNSYGATQGGTWTRFSQSGGVNRPQFFSVSNGAQYSYTGGEIGVDGGFEVRPGSTLDCNGAALPLSAADGSLVNLAGGTFANGSAVSLTVGANSLLILPAGTDPNALLGSITAAGMVHTAGSALNIAGGTGFSGWGNVDDFVECGGTVLARQGGWIHLNNGVSVSPEGSLNLGSGGVTVVGGQSGNSGGQLYANNLRVGYGGSGTFTQSGGTCSFVMQSYVLPYCPLIVDSNGGDAGTYILDGGQLTCVGGYYSEYLGMNGAVRFIQTGGTHDNPQTAVFLGAYAGSTGEYRMSGGTANVKSIIVASNGAGLLDIAGPGALANVRGTLGFGPAGTFTAGAGAAIHMIGNTARLDCNSTSESNLAGLNNLTTIFEGQDANAAVLEAAGRNLGADANGFANNFALDALQLGGSAGRGWVKLADAIDNQPSITGAEALYTKTLALGAGAHFETGGLDVYYLNGGSVKQFFCGDVNLDGGVDIGDLSAFGASWKRPGGMVWADGDLNGDGTVDIGDLSLLGTTWGRQTLAPAPPELMSGTPSEPVPEPCSLALLAAGGLLLARRRLK